MREIKFRAWDKDIFKMFPVDSLDIMDGITFTHHALPEETGTGQGSCRHLLHYELMQCTGLKDKNGLTDIYEGDILDENGLIRGNVYESPQIFRKGIDCIIAGMGTSAWRSAESVAMGRGCQYSE